MGFRSGSAAIARCVQPSAAAPPIVVLMKARRFMTDGNYYVRRTAKINFDRAPQQEKKRSAVRPLVVLGGAGLPSVRFSSWRLVEILRSLRVRRELAPPFNV